MALTLPYPTMSAAFAPTGAATIDQFSPPIVHSDVVHNNPHAKLLANDIALLANDVAITASLDSLDATVSASNPASWDWTQHVLTTSGYQKLPGGLIMQWNVGLPWSVETWQVVWWPIVFPHAILNAQVTGMNPTGSLNANEWFQIVQMQTNSVTILYQRGESSQSISQTPYAFAIGY